MAASRKARRKPGAAAPRSSSPARYEVIDGERAALPTPLPEHERVVAKLYQRLADFVHHLELGEVLTAPVEVHLADGLIVAPDLVYIARARQAIVTGRSVAGLPDLIVEVSSPDTEARDRSLKLRRYDAAGVSHYWIIDLHTRTVETFFRRVGGYEQTGTYGLGSIFQPDVFPGLEVLVDDIWG